MMLALSILAVPAIVAALYTPATIRWYRARRRDLPMTHPVMQARLRDFRAGDMPCHEDAPLDAAWQHALRLIEKGEPEWIGDAVNGRSDGEQVPLPENED